MFRRIGLNIFLFTDCAVQAKLTKEKSVHSKALRSAKTRNIKKEKSDHFIGVFTMLRLYVVLKVEI